MKVYAPINIALIKYWGKASEDPVLPSTPSISLTLEDLGSETTLETSDAFKFTLNGTPLQGEALEKMRTFFRLFSSDEKVHISSVNTAPTAAGVASSASGFAAFSLLLKETYAPELAFDAWVKQTAYGSGSATRSLLGGAVMWHENGQVSNVPFHADHYQMAVVMIDTRPKKVSSRAQMKQSLTHPNFHDWQRRNRDRAEAMIQAMAADDFNAIGTLMESSTLDMHGLIALSGGGFSYLTDASMAVFNALRDARSQGLNMYGTADAGPNIKVLFETSHRDKVETFLATLGYPVVYSKIALEGARICT